MLHILGLQIDERAVARCFVAPSGWQLILSASPAAQGVAQSKSQSRSPERRFRCKPDHITILPFV